LKHMNDPKILISKLKFRVPDCGEAEFFLFRGLALKRRSRKGKRRKKR
jgi:hypothetical protein